MAIEFDIESMRHNRSRPIIWAANSCGPWEHHQHILGNLSRQDVSVILHYWMNITHLCQMGGCNEIPSDMKA